MHLIFNTKLLIKYRKYGTIVAEYVNVIFYINLGY